MDNQELIDSIINAEDVEIITNTTPCIFLGNRILSRILISNNIGYKLTEQYLWIPAYNTHQIHGGYELKDVQQTITKL